MKIKINTIADEKRVVRWCKHWVDFWIQNDYSFKMPEAMVEKEYRVENFRLSINKKKLAVFEDLPITIRLTQYGCSGFYWPQTNEIFINVNYKGDIIKLIKHEIIHLLIEDFINKNHISQKAKEKLVDALCGKI